ncbi:putative cobaltochelatase [Methanosarcina mazei]|uniref:Magnesium chelatase n=3 Tax=Methanosarcina mazei TaxID=2209 RepID=A0A0F8MMK3_METMZ|nr:putative cobaltochelatase [Methanosarcina mazei]AAM31699.1 Magnesium-chelatase subunit [Methanosarcina mazei Go1]AKB71630.1 ChlI component of cobalt chelatase involved in B12 biosynthesis [Methanosarcina mazei C16]KKG29414.1 magnesium chelatase [Methanosarcina mazei]KKG39617.1 magnesium chelatase [Methanosarcina mazei]KKG44284.1 magnesium chelatase [Methanosarcina mazei]
MKNHNIAVYPFTAIVGQEKMKKALVLNLINPKLGGVLVRGEKGTAKSTAVRALANLLPEIEVVEGCKFKCNPQYQKELCEECLGKLNAGNLRVSRIKMKVVDLPVSATEDRVVGTLDIEHAIKKGEKRFEPGVLAMAHRGILYVDEINLLDDHIVDVLLDSAAMGVNTVEREGISYSHPANFVLVGTMNPEEGELRPQLLDRFGLCVDVKGISDVSRRVELIKYRLSYEADPEGFAANWQAAETELCGQILTAKQLLSEVRISDDMLELISQICVDMGVDGHRADITMMKTSITLSAFNGRADVLEEDVKEAAELVLSHRMRRKPFDSHSDKQDKLDESIEKHREKQKEKNKEKEQNRDQNNQEQQKQDRKENPEKTHEHPEGQQPENAQSNAEGQPDASSETIFATGESYQIKQLAPEFIRADRKGSGRRSKTFTSSRQGRYIKSAIPHEKTTDLAFDATLRAAAPYQLTREKNGNSIIIHDPDLRKKIREKKIGNLVLFVVDASGSMGARQRMVASKGAVLSMLMDAYQKRDRVGLIAFKGDSAELLLPPTSSIELAQKYLQEMPTGGKTPISRGLVKGYEIIKSELRRDPDTCPFMVLISDGRANVSMNGEPPLHEIITIASRLKEEGIQSAVIDTESSMIKFGFAQQISTALGATYLTLENLKADSIVNAVRASAPFEIMMHPGVSSV